MILTCPECSARYVVDPKALLPAGRVVRCAKCKHSWKEDAPKDHVEVVADAVETAAESPPEATNAAPEEDEFSIRRRRRKKRPRPMPKGTNLPALQNHKHGGTMWGWYGLGGFVALIIVGFLIFQSSISDIWPPSKKLYRALGLESNALARAAQEGTKSAPKIPWEDQYKIQDISLEKVSVSGVITLKIKGNVANLTDKTLPLPLLRIHLRDDQGQSIRDWTFKSEAATISPDGKVPFATSLPNPPGNATSISVTFTDN